MSEDALAPRTIGLINWVGLYTLVQKEIGRFVSVYMQTIVAPVVTTLMFYTVFALAFGGFEKTMGGVPFMDFLAPGLVMMTMAQNAFANTSSSLVIAKVQGNIVDVVMPPLSAFEIYLGYIIGAVARGMSVGFVTALCMAIFIDMTIQNLFYAVVFGLLGTMMMGAIGIAAGIWSEKFDHIAAVTNFIVTPLTFLSGTFYSIDRLPEMWQGIAHFNPFFYMIDGFRSGFIAYSDGTQVTGITMLVAVNVFLTALSWWMLKTGYKVKS